MFLLKLMLIVIYCFLQKKMMKILNSLLNSYKRLKKRLRMQLKYIKRTRFISPNLIFLSLYLIILMQGTTLILHGRNHFLMQNTKLLIKYGKLKMAQTLKYIKHSNHRQDVLKNATIRIMFKSLNLTKRPENYILTVKYAVINSRSLKFIYLEVNQSIQKMQLMVIAGKHSV